MAAILVSDETSASTDFISLLNRSFPVVEHLARQQTIRQLAFGVNLSIGNATKTQRHQEIGMRFRK
jgi:hypothetical protein